jgi:hypothetical protein
MVARGVALIACRPYGAGVPPATRTRQLVEVLLGEPLEGWVVARRAHGLSWKAITAELAEATDGQCDLNRETLRAWFAEVDPTIPLGRPA